MKNCLILVATFHYGATGQSYSVGWTKWGAWSECTQSDGYGSRIRYRQCTSGPCKGDEYDVEECTDDQVPYCRDLSDTTIKCSDSEPSTVTGFSSVSVCLFDNANTATTLPTVDLDPGSTCALECGKYEVVSGGVERVTCDEDGEWNGGELGTCGEPTCDELSVPNGSLYCSGIDSGESKCMVACEMDYYQASGDSELHCRNGNWTGLPVICAPKPTCDNVNSVAACVHADCQDTCENYLSQDKQCATQAPCQWACKCKNGYVKSSSGECIKPDQCGCLDAESDVNFMPGVSIIQDFCTRKCTCMGTHWSCEEYQCPNGESCSFTLDGKEQCAPESRCPANVGQWTQWVSIDVAEKGNERESAQKTFSMFPTGDFCQNPVAVRGRSKIEPDKDIPHLINTDKWLIRSSSDRLVCNKRDQEYKDNCPDLEASYCCQKLQTTCPEYTSAWTEWSNVDQNKRDGGDFELLVYHRQQNPSLCDEPMAIDYRSSHGGNEKIPKVKRPTVSLVTGLVCYDEGKRKCPDFSVRFCCPVEHDLSCLLNKKPFIPQRPNPEWLPPNACCGERPFNTNLKICCDGRLVDIANGCPVTAGY